MSSEIRDWVTKEIIKKVSLTIIIIIIKSTNAPVIQFAAPCQGATNKNKTYAEWINYKINVTLKDIIFYIIRLLLWKQETIITLHDINFQKFIILLILYL